MSVLSKERLTKFVTPVGMPMTTLNSMKHYMPCVPCRHNAKLKTDSNGNQYTEKFDFCDTCEVKMLFNRLKEYEDLEEQGLLLRLPCKVGDTIYKPNFIAGKVHEIKITVLNLYESEIGIGINGLVDNKQMFYCRPEDFGKTVFLTQSEAEKKLRELEGK